MTDTQRGEGVDVGWVTLEELPQGALFETRSGTLAVKSEYRYPNGDCECTLLDSGEYAHFSGGNHTEVREIDLSALRQRAEAAEREQDSRIKLSHRLAAENVERSDHEIELMQRLVQAEATVERLRAVVSVARRHFDTSSWCPPEIGAVLAALDAADQQQEATA